MKKGSHSQINATKNHTNSVISSVLCSVHSNFSAIKSRKLVNSSDCEWKKILSLLGMVASMVRIFFAMYEHSQNYYYYLKKKKKIL